MIGIGLFGLIDIYVDFFMYGYIIFILKLVWCNFDLLGIMK